MSINIFKLFNYYNLKYLFKMSEQDALDAPNLNVKEYFKNYIKTKKIEELIATDNKLFSEVRNLESEKHVLVTQNYKKFVSAT